MGQLQNGGLSGEIVVLFQPFEYEYFSDPVVLHDFFIIFFVIKMTDLWYEFDVEVVL